MTDVEALMHAATFMEFNAAMSDNNATDVIKCLHRMIGEAHRLDSKPSLKVAVLVLELMKAVSQVSSTTNTTYGTVHVEKNLMNMTQMYKIAVCLTFEDIEDSQ